VAIRLHPIGRPSRSGPPPLNKLDEIPAHAFQRSDPVGEVCRATIDEVQDVRAGRLAPIPEGEDLPDLP
jgi:hypothetical protein